MAEPAVGQEEELFSLSMRPFQQAKQSGKTICFKCFEEDGAVNFFLEGAGLAQHFRTMHLYSLPPSWHSPRAAVFLSPQAYGQSSTKEASAEERAIEL